MPKRLSIDVIYHDKDDIRLIIKDDSRKIKVFRKKLSSHLVCKILIEKAFADFIVPKFCTDLFI